MSAETRLLRASDMSEHWRLVSVESDRVSGTFWVSRPLKPGGEAWVKSVDVYIWHENRRWARVLNSSDLTASVQGGVARITSTGSDKRADIEDVTAEMLLVLAATVDAALPAPPITPQEEKQT